MPSTHTAKIVPPTIPAGAAAPQATVDTSKPAIIATRARCEADGVGLSHYILMDRKAGQ